MKKKDSKKSKKKKKKQKAAKSPELSQLKELTDTVKSMAKELTKLQKTNKSLKAEIQKIKKKEKTPEVVTKVMEPQVLPPVKPKRTRKLAATKAASPKSAPAVKANAKPGPKRGRRKVVKKPAAPNRPGGSEDLRFIQGLGDKIKSLLNEKGIKTFTDLAKASQVSVKAILEQAGPRFKNQDPKPLIDQAKFIKNGKWADLESLQADLMKGKGKPGPKTGARRKKSK